MKPIKARFIGVQDMYDGSKAMLYNILEDIGDGSIHPCYSTLTLNTLEKYGLTPVDEKVFLPVSSHG